MKEERNMNINRFNYEEYFLLYVDNELSAEEKREVEQFTATHPDLGEELDLLMQVVSKPEKHQVFTNKDLLMKSSLAEEGINELNYEGFFISYLDDELSTPEKAAVETFLYAHPELESVFDQFQQAKLVPEKIVFHSKESLYRREKEPKVIPFGWFRMAAAAAVIFVAGFFWFNKSIVSNLEIQLAIINVMLPKDTDKSGKAPEEAKGTEITSITDKGKLPVKENNTEQKQAAEEAPDTAYALMANTKKQLTVRPKKRSEVFMPDEVHNQQLSRKPIVQQVPTRQQINTIAAATVNGDDKSLALVQPVKLEEVVEDNNATLTFVSDHQSENVFLTNIPVDNNAPLRGLFRKASRVINKVAALKNRSRAGISIGNVEIAIQ